MRHTISDWRRLETLLCSLFCIFSSINCNGDMFRRKLESAVGEVWRAEGVSDAGFITEAVLGSIVVGCLCGADLVVCFLAGKTLSRTGMGTIANLTAMGSGLLAVFVMGVSHLLHVSCWCSFHLVQNEHSHMFVGIDAGISGHCFW